MGTVEKRYDVVHTVIIVYSFSKFCSFSSSLLCSQVQWYPRCLEKTIVDVKSLAGGFHILILYTVVSELCYNQHYLSPASVVAPSKNIP